MLMVIKTFNDSVLRKKAKKVKKVDEVVQKLINDMAQTMEHDGGIGLAATQVGVSKRVIVVKLDQGDQRVLALVNPKIIRRSRKKKIDLEGCLSFPGIYLEIKRSVQVDVRGLDRNGDKIEIKTQGLLARVLQHEIDHLDGILFFNRLNIGNKLRFLLKYPRLKI